MYFKHTRCRACGLGPPVQPDGIKNDYTGPRLEPALGLGLQPLPNDFVKEHEEHGGFAPLEVLVCPRCGLAQLSVVVRPEILYSHYAYTTSNSEMMRQHFDQLVKDIAAEASGHELFEIGCNDGRLLTHFHDSGPFYPVYGMDPADNLCSVARKAGHEVTCAFFGEASAKLFFVTGYRKPDVILARHVFAHIDDWQDFIRGLDHVAGPDTLICIEVPYAWNQLAMNSWDQIYFEHLSYVNVRAVVALLATSPFYLQRIKSYQIHGGVILLMLRRRGNPPAVPVHESVDTFLDAESVGVASWQTLDFRMRQGIREVKEFVHSVREQGKKVCAYGASAKCTVWMNAAGFTKNDIAFACDNTPWKQWRNIPGTNIPVVDDGALTRELPDYALLTAWNFRTEIINKEKLFREKGGKWIVPIPKLEIV